MKKNKHFYVRKALHISIYKHITHKYKLILLQIFRTPREEWKHYFIFILTLLMCVFVFKNKQNPQIQVINLLVLFKNINIHDQLCNHQWGERDLFNLVALLPRHTIKPA